MKRTKNLLWGVFAAGWILCSTECMAFTPVDATVKDIGINIRSEAGTSGSVISSAAAGSKLRVCDAVTGKDGMTWYMVYVDGTTKGYIRGDLVTLDGSAGAQANATSRTDASATQSQTDNANASSRTGKANASSQTDGGGKGTVTGSGARIRSLNSTGSAIVTVAAAGTEVTLLQKTTGADARTWYQVSLVQEGKNVVGYIRSDLVKIVKDITADNTAGKTEKAISGTANGAVRGSNVNVRMQPVDGTSIGKVSTGHSVQVTKQVTGSDGKTWYYIRFTYGGVAQEGYIRSDFVVVEETVSQEEGGQTAVSGETTGKTARIKGVNVRIRQSAVNGTVICQQSSGFAMTVDGELTGSDGRLWYQVSFTYQKKQRQGFVRSDFVTFSEENVEQADDEYAAELMQKGFPKSYQAALLTLHAKHPSWTFVAVQTGISWSDAVTAESRVGKNFVPKNSIASYKSVENTAYSYKNDKWYTFDGGSWVAASREAVAYYMDPRNFLDETEIYQFETLEYKDYQTKEGVSSMLASTFMKGSFTEPDGTKLSYAQTFVDIGKQVGVNPYHLAARCYQEQGNGRGDSISGKVEGYKNIFNYFHVGAYAVGGDTPVRRGLVYAAKADSKYQRPWNTRYKSLLGGAMYLADKFITKNQNTLYFQKFNVINSQNGIYSHQYMTNLMAASSEAARMKKAYDSEDGAMEFIIPIYDNMPESACAKPTADLNPNNYLKSLTVGKQKLTPAFDGDITEYSVTVSSGTKSVTIAAAPVAKTSTVSQTGKVSLQKGLNTFTIVCRSASGSSRTYTLKITRK